MEVVIRAAGVAKRWGNTAALVDATFTTGHGVTGLVGANGAGKTTLLGLLLGLHRPDAGTIEVLGRDPAVAGAGVRARIGYAPEHDALPPDVSAHEIVRHLAEVHGLPRRAATERASDVLWEVGLGEERFRPVGTFSTGQRQRVKLAQAIAHDPQLVLLDEPTNGLDPVQREEMLALVMRVGRDLGIDVVLSSHLLEEVDRVSDAVVILDAGRAIRSGRLDALRGGPTELLVELDEGPDGTRRLLEAFDEAGVVARIEGTMVVVALNGPVVLDLVRDALAISEVSLRRMAPRSATLEELFLDGPKDEHPVPPRRRRARA